MEYLSLASLQGFLFVVFILAFVVFKSWKIATSSTEDIQKSFRPIRISAKIENIVTVLKFFVSGPSIIMDGYANVSFPQIIKTTD